MPDFLFLTGATGLLGRYLLRDLLAAGTKVAVLVRASRRESARQRVESIMEMWESESGLTFPRPVCLEGNICDENLGLSDDSLEWVAENCSTMMHSAASLSFRTNSEDEPYRSNVGGTRHVLEVCHNTGIQNMHYVSTAYVCGLRDDLVRENELDLGQCFRNDYEETKLEAEQLVRGAGFLRQTTVYRPAVISGD
ncbi:MAG: SDR family oxidoreductase, partial [Pirellulales bacterium]|nr:SDR family oxidoreductase [Pirellulales bacterium]